jgi:hypothetical protein
MHIRKMDLLQPILIYGLSYKCPKDKVRDNDCPFFEIGHLTFDEKIRWIDQLCDIRKEAVLKHHSSCTKESIKNRKL